MSTKAAPQPCEWADSYGCEANLHIRSGRASIGPENPVKNKLVPSMVIISGAVSPAILEIANTIPVSIPLLALFIVINNVIFHFGIPRDWAASRNELGTILKDSSVTLTTMGIIIIDKAKAPAQTENEPSRRTIDTYPTIPITIEGKPVKTSLKNLTAEGNIPLPAYSER